MDRNGVELAALIQINGQSDNSYQSECVRRYPDRLRSVVIVDVASPNAPAELERLAAEGATGVRLPARTRSPGDDPLAIWRKAAELGRRAGEGAPGGGLRARPRSRGDDPLAIWRKAAELGLTVSSGGGREGFLDPGFGAIFEAFPPLPIVIEHLGSENKPAGES